MKPLLIYACLLCSVFVAAQQKEPIEADRPDQTETPSIVPKGMFQLETGLVYEKHQPGEENWTTPTMLWKYGVNENFELRLITEYHINRNNSAEISGLTPVLIGCKIKICEEKGIVPKTSFIGHIALPNVASSVYKTDYYAPQFRFTMQHSVAKKLKLSYNIGAEWDGFTAEPQFIYTFSTGYEFSEKLGGYVELFGFAPQNDTAAHNFDAGFTYLLSNDFMLDLSGGAGLTENAPDYYVSAGFSFRI